jgi:hypothetical protein
MDQDKGIIVGVDTGVGGPLSIVALIKGGGSFATSDLQGTWHLYVLDDGPSSIEPGGDIPSWVRGTLAINADGSITGGSAVSSDGPSFTFSGGSLSITSSGIVSGTVDIVGEDSESISQIKMDQDKSIIVGVGTNSSGEPSIIALIKGATRPKAMPWLMLLLD